MAQNYVSRTFSEALERIRREHGPEATIIKVWEFQRPCNDGVEENWVGITVGDSSEIREKSEVSKQGAQEQEASEGKFGTMRARWRQVAIDEIEASEAEWPQKKLQKPIDPESPSQSQVMKVSFSEIGRPDQSAQKSDKAPTPDTQHPVPDTQHPTPDSLIGGMEKEHSQLREMVEYPMRYPEMFNKLGIEAPRGVLLCGPPGCGKTLLARSIARSSQAHFQVINGPELVGTYQGESERNLRKIFEEAEKHAPSILFFDEIDAITPVREEASGAEKRLVTQFLTLMDGLESRGQVIIIASTNTPNSIDSALRRPGRFDREIWFSAPEKEARKKILEVHTRDMALEPSVDLDDLAERTHGFVGADLAALCREAGIRAIREVLPRLESAEKLETICDPKKKPGDDVIVQELCVGRTHFEAALSELRPASLRNQQVNVPKINWKEIGGLEVVKRDLEEAVIWPMKHPALFKEADVSPAKGLLLTGPPGTGKTLMAKALASESGINFISVKGPSLISKYVGESEKAIRDVFEQARQAAPCIIFFDEIDAIAPVRGADASSGFADRLVAQLLVEMDGIEKLNDVTILGTTNRPEAIDPALRRPGRFDKVIQIPLPDETSRLEILKVHTHRKPLDASIDLHDYATQTDGFSGADLESVCRLAALAAVRRAVIRPDRSTKTKAKAVSAAVVYPSDFDQAIEEVDAQVRNRQIEEATQTALHAAARGPFTEELPATASQQFFMLQQQAQREGAIA